MNAMRSNWMIESLRWVVGDSAVMFGACVTREKLHQRSGSGLIEIKNGVNRIDDGRAHARAAGSLMDGKGIGHALGDHAEMLNRLRQ